MKAADFHQLDCAIARARIVMSLLTMLSLYVDPTTAGGLFHLDELALSVLLCHLGYSLGWYAALKCRLNPRVLALSGAGGDLFFATAVAFMTQGQTSPSYVFFVFAVIAVGMRGELRSTVAVTLGGVTLYLLVIGLSNGMTATYMMRAVYLAIAGYLIGFVGQQRALFERRLRLLESAAQRQSIARSLHDGYIQALAGVNLRLESCRELLSRKRLEDALHELTGLQEAVAREYDEVRAYIRSLAGIAPGQTQSVGSPSPRLQVRMEACFSAHSELSEHILQIMLEALRNARRHAMASALAISASETPAAVRLRISDDGVGFASDDPPPWAISSRIEELGGRLRVSPAGSACLEMEMPKAQP